LASEVVRYVGEPVALVAASTRREAKAAAAKVHVEYEELSALDDPEAALAPDAPVMAWGEDDDDDAYADYGLDEDDELQSAGPPVVHAAETPELATKRVAFWEDDDFIIFLVNDGTTKKFVAQSKTTGSKIELNLADGDGGKSETIALEARTAISIYSDGIIDIDALRVQIQGRVVSKLTGAAI